MNALEDDERTPEELLAEETLKKITAYTQICNDKLDSYLKFTENHLYDDPDGYTLMRIPKVLTSLSFIVENTYSILFKHIANLDK